MLSPFSTIKRSDLNLRRLRRTVLPHTLGSKSSYRRFRVLPGEGTGQEPKSPRKGFIYFSDDGDLVGVRFDNWKVVFMEQRVEGTLRVWQEPFVVLRLPKLSNLRTDPFERAETTSNTYNDWLLHHGFLMSAGVGVVSEFLKTFKEFPPRQKAASFTIDQAMEKMEKASSGALR
jgi:hypothetical protein